MLEEVSMDKKATNRSVQTPIKGSGTELKKPQDAQSNGKQVVRGCRKREPSGSNSFKYDQNRKPTPQKSKTIDKRPQSRGIYYGGKENTQVRNNDIEGEFGSLFSNGRKKQNLNHLLNFHYEPRGEAMQAARQPYKKTYTTKALMATQAHKYNKEQFLQANCQFIVRSGEDYSPYMADPDLLVNWDLVEMIRVWSNEIVTCPICLYPPVAGKITRCGHVFCWPCILHYLALSDKTWRKCPICYEAVHKNDLKSVECIENSARSVGETVTLQLMKREKGSFIATPVTQHEQRCNKPLLHISEETLDTIYSKLLLASHNDIMKIIQRENKELDIQLEECKGCPELCFVEQAVDILTQRKLKLETGVQVAVETPTRDKPILMNETNIDNNTGDSNLSNDLERHTRARYESFSSEGEDIANVSAEDLYIGTNQNSNQQVKYFYFYQAIDGQQIYLHAINVRMLEMNYGSLENCPHTITGSIVEKESGSMTTELRKRLRYMQHIPITCQFDVVEIALAPPVILENVLTFFQEQLEHRRQNRVKRAREERRREKKIEGEMFGGRRRAPNLRIESLHHFPECGVELPPPPVSPQMQSHESSRASSPISVRQKASPFSCAMASLSIEEHQPSLPEDSGPSFAQMLREGKTMRAAGVAWPTVGDAAHQMQPSSAENDEPELAALSPPPKHCFSFAEALQNTAILEQGSLEGSNGKKKKKKQKVLFSTGMACTGK